MTLRPSVLLLAAALLGGCGSQSFPATGEQRPHLLGSPAAPVGGIKIRESHDYRLELARLQARHQERLAAIEAQKAKRIKELESRTLLTREELQKQIAQLQAQSRIRLEEEKRRYARLLAQKEQALKALEAKSKQEHDRTLAEIARIKAQTQTRIEQTKEQIAALKARRDREILWGILGAIVLLALLFFLFYRYRKRLSREAEAKRREHEFLLLERQEHARRVDRILDIVASKETESQVKVELVKLLGQGIARPDQGPLIEYKPKDKKER